MMKRIMFIFLFFFLLASCQKAGIEGRKCLEGNVCAEDNLVCTLEGICEPCGHSNDPCCQNEICADPLTCGADGTCQLCGNDNAPCCSGGKCINSSSVCNEDNICVMCGFEELEPCCKNSYCEPGLICNDQDVCILCGSENEICCKGGDGREECYAGSCTPENICKSTVCTSQGFCTSCGYDKEPCYEGKEGGACIGGAFCREDNICITCGYIGEPVCEDGKCDKWFVDIDGYCNNPFKADPGTDLKAVCERAESRLDSIDSDWCYWNAAYYKRDDSICELIQWGEMRALCTEMKNPAYYYAMYF